MFRSTRIFGICCISFSFAAMGGFQATAQVPDVGPGVCVQASGTCDDPTPSYSRSSRSSGGASYSGPTARQRAALQHQQIMNNMMLSTMQGLMGNFMEGFQRGMEQNRQRQLQQQQELLRQAREELERERQRALAAQQAMQRNRQQLQDAKKRIAGVVRSMGSVGTAMRPMLSVEEATGAFGTPVLKPRDIENAVVMDDRSKAACGQELLNAAGSAAVNGSADGLVASFKEAAFLSRQANRVISGGDLDVSCPTADDGIAYSSTDDLNLINETIQQQSEVFGALYDRIADNMERMSESREILLQAEAELTEAQTIRDEAENTVKALQSMEPSQDTPSSPIPAQQEDLDVKKTALAEALAALEQSEQALADIQQVYDQNKTQFDELETSMKSMETLLRKSQDSPQGMTELRDELRLPSMPRDKNPG